MNFEKNMNDFIEAPVTRKQTKAAAEQFLALKTAMHNIGIPFDENTVRKYISSRVTTDDGYRLNLYFAVDEEMKMLLSISIFDVIITADKVDEVIRVCNFINNRLLQGCVYYDDESRTVSFRMATNWGEKQKASVAVAEFLINKTGSTAENYVPYVMDVVEGNMTYEDFVEEFSDEYDDDDDE